jgi:hypothetical protein
MHVVVISNLSDDYDQAEISEVPEGCAQGPYTDVDDLVFAVAPAAMW